MSANPKRRDDTLRGSLIAFSVSYDRENLLARGMGLDHLKELLRRLGTLLLRARANLAYGGNWKEAPDNLTYTLVRVVSDEQEEGASNETPGYKVGKLYNHASWPHYLELTPKIEAQWINCCTVVRITQEMAGIAPRRIVPDQDWRNDAPQTLFNKAVTLTALRRLMMEGMTVPVPEAPAEIIPAVAARIALGGKLKDYSGFLPGIFEEVLFTLRKKRPLLLLGGFGGAAELLAKAILVPGYLDNAQELTMDGIKVASKRFDTLMNEAETTPRPVGFEWPADMLAELVGLLRAAQAYPAGALNTGLNDADTRLLLTTNDIPTVVRLVNIADKSGMRLS